MVSETNEQEGEDVIDLTEFLRDLKRREELGLIPRTPTIEERMKAQGKRPFTSVDDIPRADFEFDVDEFLRIIYEARKW